MSGLSNAQISRIIALENVQDEVDTSAVTGYLGSFGKVIKVQFWNSQNEKRHAFVTFETAEAAKQALHLVNDPGSRLPIKPVNKNNLFRYQPPGSHRDAPSPPPAIPSAPLQDRLRYDAADDAQRTYTNSRKPPVLPSASRPSVSSGYERTAASATSTRPYDHSAPKDINLRATLSLRTKELQDSKNELERLKGLEATLTRALESDRKANVELQHENQKLNEHLKLVTGEAQYFRKKADEAASIPNRQREFEEAEKKYKGEVNGLSNQVKSLRAESDHKDQIISNRDSELTELKRKYEALQADYSRLSEEHQQLQRRHFTRSPSSKPYKLEDGEPTGDMQLISRQASSSMSDAEVAKIVTLAELEKAYLTLDELVTLALINKASGSAKETARKKRRIEEG